MASHHHFCHHSAAPIPTPTACNCHCYYAPCHHHPPPLPPPALHPTTHFYSDPINLPNPLHFRELHHDRSFQDGPSAPAPTVSSLLRRISALESALGRRSPHSIRDAAARTIQTHFRAFLCRRSRTLRHLKDLAGIKSTLGNLKTLISKNPQFDYDVVYRRTVNLLVKLDNIKGDDPMIRNGKTSLTTELNRFVDLIDGICVERKVRCRGVDLKSRVSNLESKLGNLKFRGSKGEKLKALVARIDKLAEEIDEEESQEIEKNFSNRIGPGLVRVKNGRLDSKVKKNVSFVENGKVYRVTRRPQEAFSEEFSDENGEGGIEDDVGQEISELGISSKEAEDEEVNEGSMIGSEVEKGSRSYPGRYEVTRHDDDEDDDDEVDEFVFRPPLPVKMETRGVSIQKRMKSPNE